MHFTFSKMYSLYTIMQAAIELLNVCGDKISSENCHVRKRCRTHSGSELEDVSINEFPTVITQPSPRGLTTYEKNATSSSSWLSSPSSSIVAPSRSPVEECHSPFLLPRNEAPSSSRSHSIQPHSDLYQCSSSDSSIESSPTLRPSSHQDTSTQSNHIAHGSEQEQRPLRSKRKRLVIRNQEDSIISSFSLSSEPSTTDSNEHSFSPSQRHPPPVGKRRVYTCIADSGIIQTECHFEGATCMYDANLPKSREALVNLPGMFQRYITCLIEQITQGHVQSILEDIDKFSLLDEEGEPLDEQQRFDAVQSLMRLQRYTANLVHHKIGRLINSLSEIKHIPKNHIVCSLCNEAGKKKERKYTALLIRCSQAGCNQCRDAQLFDSLGRHATVPITPCIYTQACCRLMELDYQNFTPTFFRQCSDVSSLPLYSPVVISSEAPSCVRTALAPLASKKLKRHSLPSLISGLQPVFSLSVGKSAVEAVQYTDGDGGYIVLEHFHLLEKYLCTLSSLPSMVFLREHGYHMLPFRELYHDAIELGHEYEISGRTQQVRETNMWGYEALVCARGNIARSVRLWLVPTTLDASGNRLLVELFTLQDGELMPCSTGVRLIEAGLSHLTNNSPVLYKEAWNKAQQKKTGIHKYNIGAKPELHPIQLKQNPNSCRKTGGQAVSSIITMQVQSHNESITCTVRNNSNADYLNEANIWILKSNIQNAGLGLFLKPTLSSRCAISIPPRRSICVYSTEPIKAPISQHSTTDYLIEVERSGSSLLYNPEVYDGRNIGRFVNQGGLLRGIQEMCLCCDRVQGGEGIQQGRIHKAMEESCNTTYQVSPGKVLHVVASQRLVSCYSPTELLINYSYTYWIKYIASHSKRLGYNNPIVSGFLWCYLSRKSVLYGNVHFDVTSFPETLLARLKDMECPFKQGQRRVK